MMFFLILEPTRFHLKSSQSGFGVTFEKKTFQHGKFSSTYKE
jgi:hypothetical protein